MPNRPQETLCGRRLTPSFGLLESLSPMQRERAYDEIVVGAGHAAAGRRWRWYADRRECHTGGDAPAGKEVSVGKAG